MPFNAISLIISHAFMTSDSSWNTRSGLDLDFLCKSMITFSSPFQPPQTPYHLQNKWRILFDSINISRVLAFFREEIFWKKIITSKFRWVFFPDVRLFKIPKSFAFVSFNATTNPLSYKASASVFNKISRTPSLRSATDILEMFRSLK